MTDDNVVSRKRLEASIGQDMSAVPCPVCSVVGGLRISLVVDTESAADFFHRTPVKVSASVWAICGNCGARAKGHR